MGLLERLEVTPGQSGALRLVVVDGWQQGRGAYGGIACGAMVEAMATRLPGAGSGPRRALRSLMTTLVVPLQIGDAEIHVDALREGVSVTTLRATIQQGGRAVAHGIGVFGAPRPVAAPPTSPPAPPLGPWTEVTPMPLLGPPAPRFTQHFEDRPTGHLPYAGVSGVCETSGWIRPRGASPWTDSLIAAVADAWWPAASVAIQPPTNFVTLAYTLEIVAGAEGLDPTEPLFHRGRSDASANGYAVDFRELWGKDGRLVAMNQQTLARLD